MTRQEKIAKIHKLYIEVTDKLFLAFFDIDSEQMLDKKINVLEKLVKGISPIDIQNYYEVLELYPKDNNIWDL